MDNEKDNIPNTGCIDLSYSYAKDGTAIPIVPLPVMNVSSRSSLFNELEFTQPENNSPTPTSDVPTWSSRSRRFVSSGSIVSNVGGFNSFIPAYRAGIKPNQIADVSNVLNETSSPVFNATDFLEAEGEIISANDPILELPPSLFTELGVVSTNNEIPLNLPELAAERPFNSFVAPSLQPSSFDGANSQSSQRMEWIKNYTKSLSSHTPGTLYAKPSPKPANLVDSGINLTYITKPLSSLHVNFKPHAEKTHVLSYPDCKFTVTSWRGVTKKPAPKAESVSKDNKTDDFQPYIPRQG